MIIKIVRVVVVWLMTMTIKVVDDDGQSGDLKDKSQYEDEIKLKVISCLLIKYTPEKLNCTFLSEKLAKLFLLREFKPPPDHKVIKPLPFDNFFPPLRHSCLTL